MILHTAPQERHINSKHAIPPEKQSPSGATQKYFYDYLQKGQSRPEIIGAGLVLMKDDKPDSVMMQASRLSFICSGIYTPESICLPTVIERAALWRQLTWHFSAQGLPVNTVTRIYREHLPHVFTLTRPHWGRAVIFCGTFCNQFALTNQSPAYHRVRCSVLSGLSSLLLRRAIVCLSPKTNLLK